MIIINIDSDIKSYSLFVAVSPFYHVYSLPLQQSACGRLAVGRCRVKATREMRLQTMPGSGDVWRHDARPGPADRTGDDC